MTRLASVKKSGVVLYAVAVAKFTDHLYIKIHTLTQSLRFNEFSG